MEIMQYKKQNNMVCVVTFNNMGHYCGYVGVNKYHPFFEVDYQDLWCGISVHGGLTYSGKEIGGKDIADGQYWFLGFDCAHAGDVCSEDGIDAFGDAVYVWTAELVMRECENLASQLKKIYDDCKSEILEIDTVQETMESILTQLLELGETADKCEDKADGPIKLSWYKFNVLLDLVISTAMDAADMLEIIRCQEQGKK